MIINDDKKKVLRCSKLKSQQPESERHRTVDLLIAVDKLTKDYLYFCVSAGI